ncbi:major capsid protein [Streptococcus thermophilus]|uniref:Phage head protein n=1 Tax=Streptococcus thermophilus M17PTZA496 TaxID=1433289 RepID=A0A0E2QIP5_STRTR|nr:major capsid protein [Streptococcus thermophilus]ETW90648.1 phage head protein [Streptococcus thermophilus M17PTZA496]
MGLIYDKVTASNIAGYFNALQENVDSTLGESIFPARKQLGTKLSYIKGASGQSVALKAAAFDTNVTIRDRVSAKIHDEQMPFFKEALLVKENDRQQLNLVKDTGNEALINTIVAGIFNDDVTLINGARARLEAMRMQVLATGKIAFTSDGVNKDIDYGVKPDHKKQVSKSWAEPSATPLADLEDAIETARELGLNPERAVMNAKTYGLIRKAASTVKVIKPLAGDGAAVTKAELDNYIADNFGVTVVLENGTYQNEKGEVSKFFPDGHLTLIPNGPLGNTVFGTTPEESDLFADNTVNADVEIVDNGIAVTTTKTTDPVNVQTKVSMVALPSFERLDDVYMLTVIPGV